MAAARRAAASLLAADRRAAASLLLPAHRSAATSLLLAADLEEASSLLPAAASLLLAAHRRAANSLLLAADREEASSLLRAATSLLLAADRPAAASMFGPVPPSTVGPQLLLTDGRTSILAQRAVLCDSQALIRSADTTTPLTGCTSTIQIAADSYTSRPTAAILGRRALFSVPSLPTRNPVSALASATGSMLSRRGMATEAKEGLTPEVQRAVEATESLTPEVQQAVGLLNEAKQRLTPEVKCAFGLIEAANAARREEYMKELREFEVEMINIYSAGRLASAETALTAGKVAWRVHTAVLAFGVTTLVAILQMVKGGWKSDFERDIEELVKKMMRHIKSELLATVRQVVMSELKVIDAEKAVKK